jgi:hypothetical protein
MAVRFSSTRGRALAGSRLLTDSRDSACLHTASHRRARQRNLTVASSRTRGTALAGWPSASHRPRDCADRQSGSHRLARRRWLALGFSPISETSFATGNRLLTDWRDRAGGFQSASRRLARHHVRACSRLLVDSRDRCPAVGSSSIRETALAGSGFHRLARRRNLAVGFAPTPETGLCRSRLFVDSRYSAGRQSASYRLARRLKPAVGT